MIGLLCSYCFFRWWILTYTFTYMNLLYSFHDNYGKIHEHWIWLSSMYFRYFVIISPWKRAFEQTLGPLHPRMHCAKFGWNWYSGSLEEGFLILSNECIFLFQFYLPLERAGPIIWTNLDQKMLCAKFNWN